MGFRITTWNVNGIRYVNLFASSDPVSIGPVNMEINIPSRNPFSYQPWRENRTYQAMFDILEADIVIMQETKIQRKDLTDDMVLVPGWDVFFSLPKHKKGYSGVAIYTRSATCAPIRAEEGITGVLTQAKSGIRFRDLPADQQIGGYPSPDQLPDLVDEETLDSEGRCVILEFPGFVLIGVYSPANRDETRDDFRISFVEVLDARIRNLVNAGKQVILTGDLNIVRSEIDSSNVAENLRKEGMSIEEWRNMPARRIFNQLIFEGQVHGSKDSGREAPVLWDICRCFHPTRQGMNTCWDVRKNTRPANYGSRIDYVLCSDGLKSWVTASNIQEGLMGSDHCPVFATIADRVQFGNKEVSVLEAMNPPGMFVDGKRQRDWSQKDLLPLSARFIPEFDGRRSIRDMFQKKNVAPTPKVQPRPAMDPGNTPFDAEAMPRKEIDKIKLKSPEHVLADASSLVERAEQPIMTGSPTKQVASSKRGADSPIAPSKKRGRLVPEASSSGTKAKTAPGQQTLQGFFKPKSTASTPGTEANGNAATGESNTPQPTAPAVTSAERIDPPPNFGEVETGQAPIDDILESSPTVFDPIVAKESWSKLLGKRVVPRCEHNEPCISQLTKKPGVNCAKLTWFRPLVLRLRKAAWAHRSKREEFGMEVWHFYLEQRLEWRRFGRIRHRNPRVEGVAAELGTRQGP